MARFESGLNVVLSAGGHRGCSCVELTHIQVLKSNLVFEACCVCVGACLCV